MKYSHSVHFFNAFAPFFLVIGNAQTADRMEIERDDLANVLGKEWSVSITSQKTLRIASKFVVSHYQPGTSGYQRFAQPYVIDVEFGERISYVEFARLRNEKAKLVDRLHSEPHDLKQYVEAQKAVTVFRIPKYITHEFSIYVRRALPQEGPIYPFENWAKCEAAAGILAIAWDAEFFEVD